MKRRDNLAGAMMMMVIMLLILALVIFGVHNSDILEGVAICLGVPLVFFNKYLLKKFDW